MCHQFNTSFSLCIHCSIPKLNAFSHSFLWSARDVKSRTQYKTQIQIQYNLGNWCTAFERLRKIGKYPLDSIALVHGEYILAPVSFTQSYIILLNVMHRHIILCCNPLLRFYRVFLLQQKLVVFQWAQTCWRTDRTENINLSHKILH